MKKISCLFLATLLVLGVFSGCSGNKVPAASTSALPTASVSPRAGGYVYTPTDYGKQELSGVTTKPMKFDMVADTVSFPLTDEKATFSIWWPYTSEALDNFSKFPDVQEIEKRTNVHIEWVQPSSMDIDTVFQLMISSQDYTDMIYYSDHYIGGGDKAIADDVYIRLNDLINDYAPNYNALRNYTESSRRATITSQGNIWAFYALCKEDMPGYEGLVVRQDFLDKIGEKEPATIKDWDTVLGKFKSDLKLKYSLGIPPAGLTHWSAFASAWNVGSSMYQENGKVKYGPAEKDFKNYLALMHDWYTKGYVRNDFYAETEDKYYDDVFRGDMAKGVCGAADGHNFFGNMLQQFNYTTDANINVVAARNPVQNAGDKMHFRQNQGTINGSTLSITTSCKKPELAVKWIDYRYTTEGYLTLDYGVEGYSWQHIDNDTIGFTKAVTAHQSGQPPMLALYKYFATGFQATLVDYTNGWCFLDPRYADQIKVWQQDGSDYNLPKLTLLTTEDASEYSKRFTEIETYVKETIPRFINGSQPLDGFDNFVKQLNSMGIARCIELQQAALDDYNSR